MCYFAALFLLLSITTVVFASAADFGSVTAFFPCFFDAPFPVVIFVAAAAAVASAVVALDIVINCKW